MQVVWAIKSVGQMAAHTPGPDFRSGQEGRKRVEKWKNKKSHKERRRGRKIRSRLKRQCTGRLSGSRETQVVH